MRCLVRNGFERLALCLLVCTQVSRAANDDRVDFEKQVRPLIAQRCFPCHSVEEHKGGLSLADRSSLLRGGDSGAAIELDNPADSLLLEKVNGSDPAGIMPPRGKGEPLSQSEIAVLAAWIAQDANWVGEAITTQSAVRLASSNHWSFHAPEKKAPPATVDHEWARDPIDAFVLERIEQERLEPSPEADRRTLIRRLSLDLIGLPPTPAEIDAFEKDERPTAYERLVDRLLASPRYGERWARRWLDLARFADTNGYEKDRERNIWPYRNWVIEALNADQPFDRFTVEQIAGDMLPGATASQKVATGYHRNTMTNEEGGIDVEEYRYISVVDRVANTGAVWLGLTVSCAQCHNHKYDPISQDEYYRLMAFLNNADEPEFALPNREREARSAVLEERIRQLEANLPARFPARAADEGWKPLAVLGAVAASTPEASPPVLSIDEEGSIEVSGPNPDRARYTIDLAWPETGLLELRLDALPDAARGNAGPGRTRHGNFVVTQVSLASVDIPGSPEKPIVMAGAIADFTQPPFESSGVLDKSDTTGWAVDDGSGDLNKRRTLTLVLGQPLQPRPNASARLRISLVQNYGGQHTLGRFGFRYRSPDEAVAGPSDVSRSTARLDREQAAWEAGIQPVRWSVVRPSRMHSRLGATLDLLDDGSVLATGDKPNTDVTEFELPLPTGQGPITAIRLETLTDPSMPRNGPGRAPLNSVGDFILTQVESTLIEADGTERPAPLVNASSDFSEPGKPAALAIDDKPDTGWSVAGGVGKPHHAVFELSEPIDARPGQRLKLVFHQFGIHQMTIGRFRLSVTSQQAPVKAAPVPAEVELALLAPAAERSLEEAALIRKQFLQTTPELAQARAEIDALRKRIPAPIASLVMQERPVAHRRETHIHIRGEFLQPGEKVEPGVPRVLHHLESTGEPNRLAFAEWLVDRRNPLVARVTINRDWQALFGRGLVNTLDDFGTRGERPTHPELLDWLAVELADTGWSRKTLQRKMVTSATYRQSSKVSPELLERDASNVLLARGSRFRVEAETVRDIALSAAGELDQRLGGPSVFPPQPDAVTALAYSAGGWRTSTGRDRYRRGLYTYQKRTAPFAAGITFDGPTSDTTCARRERSNTPLQALTLLNDTVFVEASRALAQRVIREEPNDLDARIDLLFRLCLGRPASDRERAAVRNLALGHLARLERGELPPGLLAGREPADSSAAELAAWTAAARVILNLDETVTRE